MSKAQQHLIDVAEGQAKKAQPGERLAIVCRCGQRRTIIGWTSVICQHCNYGSSITRAEAEALRKLHPSQVQTSQLDRSALQINGRSLPTLPPVGQLLSRKRARKPLPGQTSLFQIESIPE